ncbi:GNAT family N-acetyltransferase [Chryseobacterium fluminis]|uniref:GNAT family N-acetyltransferase n=1 Tax=Chryseobacterium fluminis TaxID=2983606 RepID=UPI00224DF9C7|nr:GNAT family N-acetyltransferase [Chryseobacterium sp. MMS21-Ot14]UZT99076.1 GNAT family N-acetyltransferase [Chryseobacterium sp. MMS21-Ot14]
MILNKNIRIQTNRLILKPVEILYIDDINEHFDAELTKYMPFNPRGDKSEIRSFIQESKKGLDKNTDLVMVALDSNNQFVGCCGIHNISLESAELGLWIKKSMQGIGLGKEIIINLIDFLENNFNLKYILYPVDEENIASRKIPEKLGFVPFKKYQKNKGVSLFLNIIEYRKYCKI